MAVPLGLMLALSVSSPASASPDVDRIVDALQEASVYVATGTDGTTSDTASTLMEQLRDNDNIVLVMLPEDPTLTTEAASRLADQISNGLDDERIVGVAIGDQFDAAASILPSGTADELMKRADTVSTNSVETLITFARNVHDWQRLNPESIAPPATADAGSWFIWVAGVVIVLVIGAGTLITLRVAQRRTHTQVRYTAPGGLNEPIRRLMNQVKRIPEHDSPMVDAVNNVCRHTEAYFTRLQPQKRHDEVAIQAFEKHLSIVQRVVDVYIDSLKNDDYFDDARATRQDALEAVTALSDSIRQSVKRNNRGLMLEFTMQTKVLSAERYK